jgi:hypothetical protein
VTFINKLSAAWTANDSLLCVGLDPDMAKLPAQFQNDPQGIYHFCREIIDATADLACSFKPQIAYFAALSAEDQLQQICDYVRENYPHIPLILDAKRGDIGATARQYAREAYDRYGADAVTVNPYMGFDSVEPYMEWSDRGVIILCRTSNAGGSDCSSWTWAASRCTSTWRSWWRRSGTRTASARWWSARPSRKNWRKCARLSATCRCWCRASARRAAILRDREIGPHREWHRHDDQLLARHSVRRAASR